jgi:Cu(I)/Ag(I) efflux system membrane fusion protein/cobalt-zinc-cadmium efflux system membrane fusion protein
MQRKLTRLLPYVFTILVALGVGYLLGRPGDTTARNGMSSKSTPGESPTKLKTLYTCGMHPEVIRDEPGYCPKCDMKLTPMDPDRTRMVLEARGESVPDSAGGTAQAKDRKILYWRAAMDPTYIRNEPGKSPMGMDLVPVYEDEVSGGPSIRIDPVTEQNMGLRYDVVHAGPLQKTVRTVGTVEYDEQGLGVVTTKINGWVEKVHINLTGTQVHKGDPLFEIYSPELYSAQEEYLVALKDVEEARTQNLQEAAALAQSRVESARDRLRLFDISDAQIQKLRETQGIRKTLTIQAQLTGIVTHKGIVEGDYLKAGTPAYKIADLSTVWVIGKVYETDLPYVRLGQEALMKLDFLPGRVYRGRVTYIYPYLEEGTREVPVRMEFHNPGYDLKPGMYATIRIESRLEDEAVLVPSMAVIRTGEREVAFVMRDSGKFEPRQVETGVRTSDDELQVISGLAPGETVVVSGQFLLDSESRLREATLKMLNPGMVNTSNILKKGPETASAHAHDTTMAGMKMNDGPTSGELRYVCPMPSHAGIFYDQPGDCPLCGMRLVPVQSWQVKEFAIDHYTCPMPEHYHVREPNPGKCPECGMTLIPVTKEEMKRFAQVEPSEMPETLYTCPMPAHANVVSDKPGTCPECGMKLVPTAGVPHGREAEQAWQDAHPRGQPDSGESENGLTLYTCPMPSHALVVSDEPGRCPECNMKLVPTSDVEHGPESEAAWRKAQAAQ